MIASPALIHVCSPRVLVVARNMLRYFKFIGQLMAKALADGRTLDLPLSPVVYRWLLGQEARLTLTDVAVCCVGARDAKRHQRLLSRPPPIS